MRVALTGAAGSIGRALAAGAAPFGEIVAFPPHSQLDLAGAPGPLRAWLAKEGPDAVVHLAGRRSNNDVALAFRENVAATYNLLSAVAAELPATRVVVASSAAVYGNSEGDAPLAVSTLRRPTNLYGASKALQEDACALARASAGLDVVVARIFNVIGAPGDTWSVLPSLIERIRAASDGASVTVTNARCTRDFVRIDDVCQALLLAATRPAVPPVLNVATGTATTIAALAARTASALQRSIDLRFGDVVDAATIRHSVGDPREALAMGWTFNAITDADILALAPQA